jgi:hypothetical protein
VQASCWVFRKMLHTENCALLGYYSESSGNCLTDVSGQPIGPIHKVQESFSTFVGLRCPGLLLSEQWKCLGRFGITYRSNPQGSRILLDVCWTALSGVITQRVVEMSYRRFGTTSWSLPQGSRILLDYFHCYTVQ